MRIAITGASGLLGRHLIPRLLDVGHAVVASKHSTDIPSNLPVEELPFDLSDGDSLARFVADSRADLIIHSAAYTDVDGCERDPDKAERLNAQASKDVVDAAATAGMKIVYISTDYVFDGVNGPYDESATPHPINAYGRTKLSGEEAALRCGADALVVRAAGFLGPGLPGQPTFAERIAEAILTRPPVRVATDQKSNITPIEFLADGMIELINDGAVGIRHVAPDEIVSRYEFAATLAQVLGAPPESVDGLPYAELNRAANRPLNGGLITEFPLTTKCPPLAETLRLLKLHA